MINNFNASFTYENYIRFLTLLKKKYNFSSFSQIKYSKKKITNTVIIRHDLDQSLEKALKMARIEYENGIFSTYFLFLKSPFYNIFSHHSVKNIEKIINMNHNLGLHYDYNENNSKSLSSISYNILKEVDIFQNYFGVKLDAVSFHRPFNLDILSKIELNNIPHTYESIFLKDFKYFSDSRGRWRFGFPLDSREYKEDKNLHILIHPIWWNEGNYQAIESIQRFKQSFIKKFDQNIYSELKGFWEEYEK